MKAYLLIILALLASPAAFAEKTLQECIDTENDLERLVCYDGIFGINKNADSYNSIESNNFTLPNNNDSFGKEQSNKEVSEISSTAKGVYKKWKNGTIVFLQNGQEWKIIGVQRIHYPTENPKVVITKGIFGSFDLKVEGLNRRFKVKRIK